MDILISILSTGAVVGPLALVAGGYLGYKFGRKVQAKAAAAILAAGEAASAVKTAVQK
jgi:hypothetical protein